MVNVDDIVQMFTDRVFNDKKMKALRNKISKGGSFEDVEEYAKLLAEVLDDTIKDIPTDQLEPILEALTKLEGKYINGVSSFVQQRINKELGTDLGAVIEDKTQKLVLDTYKKSKYTETEDLYTKLKNSAITENLKQVDNFQKKNAEFHSNIGFKVTVTRIYDEIGLRDRTEPCQWCLSRCGVDVPYDEAIERGMFERHEGCGCKIIYKTINFTSTQRRKGAWTYE